MSMNHFPRPHGDNGRGVVWSTQSFHDRIHPSAEYWIDQLQALQIKWVKLLDNGRGSGLPLSRKLLAAGIFPIVGIHNERLNPRRLSTAELATVRRYVDSGVVYFESNSEPDRAATWLHGQRPTDWAERVVDAFIADAEGILQRGGLPALPALHNAAAANLAALVAAHGRVDLFERGAWVALHNRSTNRPWNYPNDAVAQRGASLAEADYQAAGEAQNAWTWGDRSLDEINALRQAQQQPGLAVQDDPACFNGYLVAGEQLRAAFGFDVPVISTAAGACVGDGMDPRYPRVTPAAQREHHLALIRHLQQEAPPWYFALCATQLAGRPLGDWEAASQEHAWFTSAWDVPFGLRGQLPIVDALRTEPTASRTEVSFPLPSVVTESAPLETPAESGIVAEPPEQSVTLPEITDTDFTATSSPGKPLTHYWLLERSAQGAALLGMVLPYVRTHGLLVGANLDEAQHAATVTLVGDAFTADQRAALLAAGCRVEQLSGDPFLLAEALRL